MGQYFLTAVSSFSEKFRDGRWMDETFIRLLPVFSAELKLVLQARLSLELGFLTPSYTRAP